MLKTVVITNHQPTPFLQVILSYLYLYYYLFYDPLNLTRTISVTMDMVDREPKIKTGNQIVYINMKNGEYNLVVGEELTVIK